MIIDMFVPFIEDFCGFAPTARPATISNYIAIVKPVMRAV
jgi:hypothetical protein